MTLHSRTFWAGTAALLLVVALIAVMPHGNTAAQPARTPRGQTDALAATLEAQAQALEMTANALGNRGSDLAATVDSLQATRAMATTRAGADGVSVLATEVAATAQYLATTVNQGAESIQATVTALSTELRSVSAEFETLLNYFAEQGGIGYENGALTAAMFVSEAQANTILDLLVEATGYDPDMASLNITAMGTIEVMLEDVATGFSGTLMMTYRLAVVNGAVTIELISVTLNGRTVPVTMLPGDVVSAVELAVDGAAVQPMLSVPQVDYSMQSLHVTDDGILLSFTVAIE